MRSRLSRDMSVLRGRLPAVSLAMIIGSVVAAIAVASLHRFAPMHSPRELVASFHASMESGNLRGSSGSDLDPAPHTGPTMAMACDEALISIASHRRVFIAPIEHVYIGADGRSSLFAFSPEPPVPRVACP